MTERKDETEREPIPDFKTKEEEAEFWDTHSLADYWDTFEPAKLHAAKNLSHGMTIRLDPKTLEKLRDLADAKGVGPTTLIRMWVLERLRAEPGVDP